jgi:hypothetical protein
MVRLVQNAQFLAWPRVSGELRRGSVIGSLYNKHDYARGEHCQCRNRHDDPSQAGTRLALFSQPKICYDHGACSRSGRGWVFHQFRATDCPGTSMAGIQGTLLSSGAAVVLRDRKLGVAAFICLWGRLTVERRKK